MLCMILSGCWRVKGSPAGALRVGSGSFHPSRPTGRLGARVGDPSIIQAR